MSEAVLKSTSPDQAWTLPSRGIVGMVCLILAEAAIFVIFVVAYIFYIGKSLTGPMPKDVLELPIFTTICLFSSSFTVHAAVSALRKSKQHLCSLWLAATVLLGGIFIAGTAHEWYCPDIQTWPDDQDKPVWNHVLFAGRLARNPCNCRPHPACARIALLRTR